jgi:D-alanyl-D-alanine carboxypeptidase (penicillin-binding protein 5/6)
LVLALMLESSNDAAVAIAEHLSADGTVAAFCEGMTQKARTLGAYNTVFLTPNGLDSGTKQENSQKWHHSTAYDLALITRYAMEVPGFVALTNTASASFASDRRSYHFNNRNRLLREYEGANGVKTGFTCQAGHCFVGAAKRGDMQLISVVLASGWGERGKAQKWVDTKAVLNHGFDAYQYETILTEGAVAGRLPVTRSREASVAYSFAEGLRLPISQQEKETLHIRCKLPEALPAPIKQGECVGFAVVGIGDEAYEIPLYALHGIARHDLKTSVEKVLNAWLGQGLNEPIGITLPEAVTP